MPAEEIAETLSVARSNVSTSLKELQSWRLVEVSHRIGDRRDHFAAIGDTWQMLLVIMQERKRREIEPTLSMLRDCVLEMEKDKQTPKEVKKRIADMLSFLSTVTNWFDQMIALPKGTLVALMKLGARVSNFIPDTSKERVK